VQIDVERHRLGSVKLLKSYNIKRRGELDIVTM
jgi:hypothetical protein